MASGKRTEYLGWGDKGDIDCDVGLGLNMQFLRKTNEQQHGCVALPCQSGIAFTPDQRQELERQTIIYKYMMASMPVPPQLLLPLSKRIGGGGGGRGGGGGGGDPEPWRCRRTDGKKWRCSRDVAPDQKYCERHSHKGRPSSRSRKPVESLLSPLSAPAPTPATATSSACNSMEFVPSPLVQYNLLPTPSYSYRYPHDRLMKKDALTTSSMCGGEASLHEDHSNSRPFIDAWSLADTDPSCSICTSTATGHGTPTGATSSPSQSQSPIHSILPLTLSVSSGIQVDDQPNISDVTVTDHEGQAGTTMRSSSSSSQPLNWMTSWMNSPPGGPLAEALCLGMSEAGSYGMRNNLEDLLPSPLPYGRSSTSGSGSKDTDEQAFRLH